MSCHPSAQITSLTRSPSPRLALEFIKEGGKDTDAMAVDPPSDAGAVPAENAPLAEAAPAETDEAKEA